MKEAKPQDGSTVKGYRTLTADDIAQMNDLKEMSRSFCENLDIERTHLSLEVAERGIVIRNHVSGDTTTARTVAFQKQPDHANAKVGATVSWVFDCGKIDQLLGEF